MDETPIDVAPLVVTHITFTPDVHIAALLVLAAAAALIALTLYETFKPPTRRP